MYGSSSFIVKRKDSQGISWQVLCTQTLTSPFSALIFSNQLITSLTNIHYTILPVKSMAILKQFKNIITALTIMLTTINLLCIFLITKMLTPSTSWWQLHDPFILIHQNHFSAPNNNTNLHEHLANH